MVKLQTIPRGMVVKQKGGFTYLQEKTRSRRRYKTPKRVRDKIARARKKLKIPIVQTALIGAPILDAGIYASSSPMFSKPWLNKIASRLIGNYTGFDINSRKWNGVRSMWGSGVTLGWLGLSKIGLFSKANRFLGRNNIPLLRL